MKQKGKTMDLTTFLVTAKQHTYAAEGSTEEKLADGARQLVYRSGPFEYRDRYYGFNPFGGEEVVWEEGKPIWCMHYWGEAHSLLVSPAAVYEFLRRALRAVPAERPFRGPRSFSDGRWTYHNYVLGSVEAFRGDERILYEGSRVYSCAYHGGTVREK